jgi:hypothetical protein
MPLYIFDCAPASTQDIERARAAAQAVFAAAGLDPAYCNEQMLALADDAPHDARAVEVWLDADAAAIAACCEGWARVPAGAHLEYEA